MIDRIFKNWKTSLLAVIIIGGAIGCVFCDKASLTEASAAIIGACGMFFAKD